MHMITIRLYVSRNLLQVDTAVGHCYYWLVGDMDYPIEVCGVSGHRLAPRSKPYIISAFIKRIKVVMTGDFK